MYIKDTEKSKKDFLKRFEVCLHQSILVSIFTIHLKKLLYFTVTFTMKLSLQ